MTTMDADQDPACWSWPLWEADRIARYARWGEDAGWYLLADWHEGRCAMCGCPEDQSGRRRGHMEDHDHSTGKTRGWLCRSCNTLEGTQPGHDAAPIIVRYRERPPALILGVESDYVNIFGQTPMSPPTPDAARMEYLQRAVDSLSSDG